MNETAAKQRITARFTITDVTRGVACVNSTPPKTERACASLQTSALNRATLHQFTRSLRNETSGQQIFIKVHSVTAPYGHRSADHGASELRKCADRSIPSGRKR